MTTFVVLVSILYALPDSWVAPDVGGFRVTIGCPPTKGVTTAAHASNLAASAIVAARGLSWSDITVLPSNLSLPMRSICACPGWRITGQTASENVSV